MSLETLQDLLVHELKDLYSAEKQLLKALPKMARAATDPDLQHVFEAHLGETRAHAERIERAMAAIGASPRGSRCDAMEGLIKEGDRMMEEDAAPEIMDAGLICTAQRVEHYEIAAYGCARAFAQQLGEDDVVAILQKTLDEVSAANEKLTGIAKSSVNIAAMGAGEFDDDDNDGEQSPRGQSVGGNRKSPHR